MVVQSQFIEMFDRCSESFKKYPISDLCHSSNDIKCGPFGTQLKQAEYTDLGIPVWGIPQINSGFTLAPDVFVSEEKARQLEQFSLVSEDIAMSRKGNVGQCALYPDSFEDGIIASDVVRIRVNKEMILPHFLVYQLHNSHQIRKQILEVSDGTVMAGINVTKMKGIIVYCPSISSQQKFKTILGQADKSKFDGLKSQFIARFGTTEQSSYPVKTLREIALSSGEYGANTPATKYNPEKGRYIRITDIDEFGNLNDDLVSPEVADNKYLLHKGDLLFARTGATVGKTYLHKTGKALYAGYLIKYQFIDTVLPEFVFAYTHSKEYYKWVELTQKVGAQPNISAKQYDGLRIIVPPLEEQKSFVGLMNQADKSKYLS